MKFKKGILYGLKNLLWGEQICKIGNTGNTLKSRISTIQTSLYLDCQIVYQTNILTCCVFYEKVLEKILAKYRVNLKREFYYISEEEIKMIFDFFNELNFQLDTDDKLLNYIEEHYPEFINNKKSLSHSNNSKRTKNKKGIFIDTGSLYI